MRAWQSASMAGVMAARPSSSRASAPGGSPIRAFESTTTFLESLLVGARGASTVITSTGSGDHCATGSGDPPGHLRRLQLGVARAWLEPDPRPQPHLPQSLPLLALHLALRLLTRDDLRGGLLPARRTPTTMTAHDSHDSHDSGHKELGINSLA